MSQVYSSIQTNVLEKKPITYVKPELPPTPSSSAISIFVNDQKEPAESFSESSLRVPSNSSCYGSFSAEFSYTRANSLSTVSPSVDDNESLYLLWTHQLLRDKGFQPSSCRLDDDDSYSIDSSITDVSQIESRMNQLHQPWWKSCFPMC
ncbi:hypothetical protein BD560DRAFT_382979 [Blakeslea trispora]|nr:hypothetical protein BD560DRAFT_382979 [Blakeslea trispora]